MVAPHYVSFALSTVAEHRTTISIPHRFESSASENQESMLKTELAPAMSDNSNLNNTFNHSHELNLDKFRDIEDIYCDAQERNIKKIKLVSLFCGAGGLDWGFKKAGFKTAIAFDFNKSAVDSFNKNHPGNVAKVVDIEKTGALGILELVRKKIKPGSDIAIIGGPPCQGFSLANVGSKACDPRNSLPRTYLEIVKELMVEFKVHFLLIENVSGIKAEKHAKTFDGIIQGIKELGLVPHYDILNAAHYGVPQVRKRMILVGARPYISKNFSFPVKKMKFRTVRQTIENFPEPVFFERTEKVKPSDFHPNHWTMKPRSEKFHSAYVAPANSRSFKRIAWDLPSKTIAFGNREILVHPLGHRRLSIYEAMRLQGFPETFSLVGTLSAQVTQVSNAVPPPMAKSIALSLKRAILSNA